MAIAIGTQLGSHEITALLGKGGMGEVYRARDTKLKREVAIKILPEEFARDADRVSRFQREAEVLASLNHPNIGGIHDVQEAAGTRYLVLELVEGETLADRIARGPIPVEEALNIARSICDALEAAHDKGIVHRDLKPANVKITPDGKVKVLDFGLAKAMDNAPGNPTVSNSPTLVNSFDATNAGVIIGTAAYMSPEQARGFAADARSDIFALGCVLYEMLTARQAFQGETVSDILASVLARDPDFALLPKDVSPRIADFLRRCLEKNRRRRWHCVGDLRAELEAIAAAPIGAVIPPLAGTVQRPLWKRAIPVVLASVIFAAAGAVTAWNLKHTASAQVVRFPFMLPEGQQFAATGAHLLTISPDGSQLVYVASSLDGGIFRQLYLRSIKELEAKPIIGTGGVGPLEPFFSSDGQWIGFFSTAEGGTIKKIALTGGAALTVCKRADTALGASWDGDAIVFGSRKGIMRVSANGGEPELIAKVETGEVASSPQLIDHGRYLLFTVSSEGGLPAERYDKAQIVMQSLSSGERKVVFRGGSDARYASTGHLVYALGPNVLAIPFDLKAQQVHGGPVPILEGIMRSSNGSTDAADFALSEMGSLAYIPGTAGLGGVSSTQQIVALADRSGKVRPLELPPQSFVHPRISPDGKYLAVATDETGEATIWIYDLHGGSSLRRLTIGNRNMFPIWTPDSRYVTFQSDREGDRGIFKQAADGSGSAQRLTKAEQGSQHEPESWNPDGKTLTLDHSQAGQHVWALSEGDPKPKPLIEVGTSIQKHSAFSPDGHWLAYMSQETGTTQVFVQPFPLTGAKYQISIGGGRAPLWSPDGKQLFYHDTRNNRLVAVDVRTQPSFSFGKPVTFPIEGTIHPQAQRNYDITPDGKQFVVILPASSQTGGSRSAPQINIVVNWVEELKQRVPTR